MISKFSFQSVCCPLNISQVTTTTNLTTTTTSSIDESKMLLNEIANHTNINLINQRCGNRVKIGGIIIGGGGFEATIGEFPWM